MSNEASLPPLIAQTLDTIKVGTIDGGASFSHSSNPINNYVHTLDDRKNSIHLLKAAFEADIANPQAEILAATEMHFPKALMTPSPEGTPIGKRKEFVPEYIRGLALGKKTIGEFAEDYKKEVLLARRRILDPVYDRLEVVYKANLQSIVHGTKLAPEFSLVEFWKSVPPHISRMMPSYGDEDAATHAQTDSLMIEHQAADIKRAKKMAASKKELPKKTEIEPKAPVKKAKDRNTSSDSKRTR